MADQIVSGAELASFLDVSQTEGDRLATQATSLVQEATGQRLVEVTDEQITLMGTTESWLMLPEIPVQSVSAVDIDGDTVDDHKLVGSRMWRKSGWWTQSANSHTVTPLAKIYEPALVTVTYTHGYPDGDQRLERARTAVFGLAVDLYENPTGSSGGYSIDDYREGGSGGGGAEAGVKVPDGVARALRRYYGRNAALVRIG